MPMIEFTQEDVNRGRIVTPNWYRVRVDEVTERPANPKPGKPASTNYWLKGTILFNAENGSKDFSGVPTPYLWLFNSLAMSNAFGFITALTGSEPTAEKRYELENAVGKEVDVFIENGLYNSVIQNQINHKYRAPRSSNPQEGE